MIEATITAARVAGAIALFAYLGGIAVRQIAESLDELRRRREKRKKEELEREWRRIPTPPPPPYHPRTVGVQPPSKSDAEERAEMLAAIEGMARTYQITPCRICANRDVDCTQFPCGSCMGGRYFIAKWRRDGEIIPDPNRWTPE